MNYEGRIELMGATKLKFDNISKIIKNLKKDVDKFE